MLPARAAAAQRIAAEVACAVVAPCSGILQMALALVLQLLLAVVPHRLAVPLLEAPVPRAVQLAEQDGAHRGTVDRQARTW